MIAGALATLGFAAVSGGQAPACFGQAPTIA
jgi:hypothetical protein